MHKVSTMLFLVICMMTIPGFSQDDDESSRRTLRGLRGVVVGVEYMQPDAEKAGLTRDLIQIDVELRLRKAGIRVLTKQEGDNEPGAPLLYVRVITSKDNSGIGLYAYSYAVELRQLVILIRNSAIRSFTTTWATNLMGTAGPNTLRYVREYIGDGVDKFINAYLSVNPKNP